MKHFFLTLFITLTLAATTPASLLNYQALESKNFILYYPKTDLKEAKSTLAQLESKLPTIKRTTGNKKPSKTQVVLQDTGLLFNGLAFPFQKKTFLFKTGPDNTHYLSQNASWLKTVALHEQTHREQLDNVQDEPNAFFVFIFGNIFSPNLYLPTTAIEGIATYQESQLDPYSGRLNEGYFNALIKTKAKADKLPNIQESTHLHLHYPIGQWYPYGSSFIDYLSKTYGKDSLGDYFTTIGKNPFGTYAGFAPRLGFDKDAKKVFQKPYIELFEDWKTHTTETAKTWKTANYPIHYKEHSSYSQPLPYNGKLYYFKTTLNPYAPYKYDSLTKLIEYTPKNAQETTLTTFTSPTSTSFDFKPQLKNGKLYYLRPTLKRGYNNTVESGYGITQTLHSHDLNKKHFASHQILEADLFAYTILSDQSIIYTLRPKSGFGSELWQQKNTSTQKLADFPERIAEIKTRDDRLFYVISKPEFSYWDIKTFTLSDPNKTLIPLTTTPWTEKHLDLLTNDTLRYTSTTDHHYQIHEHNINQDKIKTYLGPDYMSKATRLEDTLYFISLTPDGEALYKIPAELTHAKPAKSIQTPSAKPPLLNEIEITSANVLAHNFKTLWPHTRLVPILILGEDTLSTIKYATFINAETNYTATVRTTALQPLIIDYIVEDIGNANSHDEIQVQLPIYNSLLDGITNINLSYRTDNKDQMPGIITKYHVPHNIGTATIESNTDTGGHHYALDHTIILPESSLQIRATKTKEFDQRVIVRGHTNKYIDTLDATTLRLDLQKRITKIRNGTWGFNAFAGDLYAGIFSDTVAYNRNYANLNNEAAFGPELRLETNIANNVQFTTTIGLALSDTDPTSAYLTLDAQIPLL